MPPLSESEFLALADAELTRIESIVEIAADEADADIEVTRTGNVLTLDHPATELIRGVHAALTETREREHG